MVSASVDEADIACTELARNCGTNLSGYLNDQADRDKQRQAKKGRIRIAAVGRPVPHISQTSPDSAPGAFRV